MVGKVIFIFRHAGFGMRAPEIMDVHAEMVHGSREECPLFTSRHAHHSSAWTISGFSVPKLCIACTIERLENRGELSVHLKKVLGEFRGLLGACGGGGSSSSLLDTLSSDRRVLEHLCNLLFGRSLGVTFAAACSLHTTPPICICSCMRMHARADCTCNPR